MTAARLPAWSLSPQQKLINRQKLIRAAPRTPRPAEVARLRGGGRGTGGGRGARGRADARGGARQRRPALLHHHGRAGRRCAPRTKVHVQTGRAALKSTYKPDAPRPALSPRGVLCVRSVAMSPLTPCPFSQELSQELSQQKDSAPRGDQGGHSHPRQGRLARPTARSTRAPRRHGSSGTHSRTPTFRSPARLIRFIRGVGLGSPRVGLLTPAGASVR